MPFYVSGYDTEAIHPDRKNRHLHVHFIGNYRKNTFGFHRLTLFRQLPKKTEPFGETNLLLLYPPRRINVNHDRIGR